MEFKNIDDMKIEEVIEEINAMYKKSQEEGLSEEEKERQKVLRQRYINNVKNNFRQQIAGYKKVDPSKNN
ncbi:MAG: DUF896 domain-containing protein [Clostridium sp.]|uniref:DUF896 domain-containing protein n=1 Tax=Clostridium culturomicium TaxID=1499683 RepID=UPI000A4BC4BF|nr:DUF896 domain-containing protein [Clostridium culturomicium]MDU4891252.1 DUF896 domain-containing protein [Clostridium sp.]MDU7085188.1 DUF896 domain-containing protein [Clostridium sp.]